MLISSRQNPAVQKYRRLVRERSYRDECGEFALEGARLCDEAVRCELTVTAFFATEAAKEKYPEIFERIAAVTAPVMISEDISGYISDTKSPQGIFLAVKTLDKTPEISKIEKGGRYLLLDELQDAGNIGTIIRTCDALGIDGIFLSHGSADIYSPKIVRGAMGSLFRLPIACVDLEEAAETLKALGYSVYAAMPDGSGELLTDVKFGEKTAVVIGNEGSGVTEKVYKAAGKKIYIPMKNAESLNAAVAASIICWEMTR